MSINTKKVLGLDIGSNSIGFALLELDNTNKQNIVFNELISNSIIFSESNTAEERREARGSRRANKRKSARNKNARQVFVNFDIANQEFITDTTNYLNSFREIKNKDVYNLRQKALKHNLTKHEFILSAYSILTNRGYCNMFANAIGETDSNKEEDEKINGQISKNKKELELKKYKLPSQVLTAKRSELEKTYQHIAVRNKRDDYHNSLDREMHKQEFEKLVQSQQNNKNIFSSPDKCKKFMDKILNDNYNSFYQRPLKSFESMVEYCGFYNKYHPKHNEKRMPKANIKNIELTIRQNIDNYSCVNKNGEFKLFSQKEKNKIVDFWINTPSSNKITNKNIFKNAGFKDYHINIGDDKELLVIDISSHRNILNILNEYKIDYKNKYNSFYNEILLQLHYFKNKNSRIEYIKKVISQYDIDVDNEFINNIVNLEYMDGFGAFSLKFANEILEKMSKGAIHSDALDKLGYTSKYLKMPTYSYLPPLAPNKIDIVWLKKNIKYFKKEHLFYQPMMSPKVKRVIGVLRKLINELIKKYGKIDEIRIETAREANLESKKEIENKKNTKNNKTNNEAIFLLKNQNIKENAKNIEKAKLFKEQGGFCLYSGEPITKDEAFDENITEVEHFIPRSIIWINSYKNKILVKKQHNQNKGSKNPIAYLKEINQWENFKNRVQNKFLDKNKQIWLSSENVINSVMAKENWQDSYLNDTRSAIKAITKYLNHYLYPSKNAHNKDEKRHIYSVSGKAINELKYMWGIHKIMPKNEKNEKDRNTNYHHTLDAFSVALCSPSAINTLHNFFKQKENKYKINALKKNLKSNVPASKNNINLVECLKALVNKYETNELYVCPYGKRKLNQKGFKDGNLDVYITNKNKTETIIAQYEQVNIDISLLVKKAGLNIKDRTDDEVMKEVENIQNRLDKQKQTNIIDAILIYANELLCFRREIKIMQEKIKQISKTKTKDKEKNKEIDNQLIPPKEKEKKLIKQQLELKCSFETKNNKKQIVKKLKLPKTKIANSKADAIVFPNRDKQKIERLTLENLKKAKKNKEAFNIKENKNTLKVELFNTSAGQKVGLNYFGSIKNNIATKINAKYKELIGDKKAELTLYKNDIIKVDDKKNNTIKYYVFNGGGDNSATNNKITIKHINCNTLFEKNKKGELKAKTPNITPNKDKIISKAKIDFFGNITNV